MESAKERKDKQEKDKGVVKENLSREIRLIESEIWRIEQTAMQLKDRREKALNDRAKKIEQLLKMEEAEKEKTATTEDAEKEAKP